MWKKEGTWNKEVWQGDNNSSLFIIYLYPDYSLFFHNHNHPRHPGIGSAASILNNSLDRTSARKEIYTIATNFQAPDLSAKNASSATKGSQKKKKRKLQTNEKAKKMLKVPPLDTGVGYLEEVQQKMGRISRFTTSLPGPYPRLRNS